LAAPANDTANIPVKLQFKDGLLPLEFPSAPYRQEFNQLANDKPRNSLIRKN